MGDLPGVVLILGHTLICTYLSIAGHTGKDADSFPELDRLKWMERRYGIRKPGCSGVPATCSWLIDEFTQLVGSRSALTDLGAGNVAGAYITALHHTAKIWSRARLFPSPYFLIYNGGVTT